MLGMIRLVPNRAKLSTLRLFPVTASGQHRAETQPPDRSINNSRRPGSRSPYMLMSKEVDVRFDDPNPLLPYPHALLGVTAEESAAEARLSHKKSQEELLLKNNSQKYNGNWNDTNNSNDQSANGSDGNNNSNGNGNGNGYGHWRRDYDGFTTSFEKKSKMTLRGTEFDAKGDVKTVSGVFLKSDLCAMHELQPRDLRTIDNYRNQLPAIHVRPSAILINLEHIRALVKADLVLLFDTDNVDKHHQSMFVFDLQERLRIPATASDALYFELRVVEAILLSVCNVLRDQYNQLSPKVNALLRKMEGEIDRTTLVNVLDMSKKLTRFESRVNSIQDAVMEILNSDEDMAGMYLTTKAKTGLSQPASMHQEVEFMFEFYGKQIEEIQSQVTETISNIRTTQSVVKITLDSQRNSLLLLELRITMGTFAIGLGSLACGIFGMNLISGLEGQPVVFYVVSSSAVVAALSSFMLLVRRMRKMTKGYRT